MDQIAALLDDMDAYCHARGIAPSSLSAACGQGGHFYKRLRAGGGCTVRTIERVRAYMRAHPPVPREGRAREERVA